MILIQILCILYWLFVLYMIPTCYCIVRRIPNQSGPETTILLGMLASVVIWTTVTVGAFA